MGKKGYATIYVDLEIIKEAHELGLNVSKICENALKEAIRRLKGENPENKQNKKFLAGPSRFKSSFKFLTFGSRKLTSHFRK